MEDRRLSAIDKKFLNRLFDFSSGWVMDFNNHTFDDFFASDVGVNINDATYADLGGSKGKRLRSFLDKGHPKAISKALKLLWEYRENYLEENGRNDEVPDSRDKMHKLLLKLGHTGLELKNSVPVTILDAQSQLPTFAQVQHLQEWFFSLHAMNAQERGFAFEKFLKAYFDLWGLDGRDSFRNKGEQIDGSFVCNHKPYLLEAKWTSAKIGAKSLHALEGKLFDRPDDARGLYVSYSGFSKDADGPFRIKRTLLLDGDDIIVSLQQKISLTKILDEKLRSAVERPAIFVSARSLFSKN